MNFDEDSFQKYFEYLDEQTFQSQLKLPLPNISNEVKHRSLKIIDKDFITELDHGILAFETYLLKEYGQNVSIPYLQYDKSGLIHQLRVKDEGTMQELWCVRDDQAG